MYLFSLEGKERLSKNCLQRKGGAVAAILFFIGVAISPGLTGCIVSAVSERNSVEVTVEVCGAKGYRPYAVSLTKPQYEKCMNYLDGLMERLDGARSQYESVLLFHEAVVELNTYGLLPERMSVSEAQRVVNGCYFPAKTSSLLANSMVEKWIIPKDEKGKPIVKNSFCALSAVATKTPGYPTPLIIPLGLLLVLGLFPALIVSILGQIEEAKRLAELGLGIWLSNPFRWANFVIFEGYDVEFHSLGLKGSIHERLNASSAFWGFTGLMLSSFSEKTYFLGSAFRIYGPG